MAVTSDDVVKVATEVLEEWLDGAVGHGVHGGYAFAVQRSHDNVYATIELHQSDETKRFKVAVVVEEVPNG